MSRIEGTQKGQTQAIYSDVTYGYNISLSKKNINIGEKMVPIRQYHKDKNEVYDDHYRQKLMLACYSKYIYSVYFYGREDK